LFTFRSTRFAEQDGIYKLLFAFCSTRFANKAEYTNFSLIFAQRALPNKEYTTQFFSFPYLTTRFDSMPNTKFTDFSTLFA